MKRKTTIIILIVFSFFALIVASTVPTNSFLTNFTFRYWIPFQGILQKEYEYKNAFDEAESARMNSNLLQGELLESKNITEGFTTLEKIKEEFSKRETAYAEMTRIDEETKHSLFLPASYRQFYAYRIDADQQDYQAFKKYRESTQLYFDSLMAFQKYDALFTKAGQLQYEVVLQNFTKESTDMFRDTVAKLIQQKQQIDQYAKQGGYTPSLLQLVETRQQFVNRMTLMNDAFAQGDIETVRQLIVEAQQNQIPEDHFLTTIQEWAKKVTTIKADQEHEHQKAYDLYKHAYSYAKDKNLSNVVDVWEGSPPGSSDSMGKEQ